MSFHDVIKARRSFMTVVLTTLLISGTAMTAASANPTSFVYAQQQATLNIFMSVVCVPTIANCPQPSQFTLQVTNNGVQGTSFQGAPQTTRNLAPGSYSVNVISFPNNPTGTSRTTDFSGCSGQINAGDIFRCDINVTYFPPSTLRVIKQVECPQGFTCPQPSTFTLRVAGTGAVPNSFQGSTAGTNVTLGPGQFRVTEVQNTVANPQGLVLVPDTSSCNGVITGTNETRQCTVINRYLQDADGDGLPNTWETDGIPLQGGGTYVLPSANPNHKNLYVELDYMTGHRPVGGNNAFGESAMQDVRSAFARAPVSNPDNSNGITLTIQVDDNITHQNSVTLNQVETTIKNQWFGTAAERANPNAANILAAKRLAFHYGLFAHEMSGGFTGEGNLPGMNFVMTLGQPGPNGFASDPATGHGGYGTRVQQAFDFMHELGHNLNLRHGGNENVNCKTNYISTMNYFFSLGQYSANNTMDFSRSALPQLNKMALNERNGIGPSMTPELTTIYNGPGFGGGFMGPKFNTTGKAIDFNINGRIDPGLVASDINGNLGDCGTPGPSVNGLLNGFNDWGANLFYVTTTGQIDPVSTLQTAGEPALNQATDLNPTINQATDLNPTMNQATELSPDDELTFEDIVLARLNLLTGIENAILRLENESETELASVEFNTTGIREDLQSGQLDAAIEQLLVLKSQVIEAFGEEAANREVVPMINNLIAVLENQKYPTPPPASDCTGTGSRNSVITGTPDPDTLIGTSGLNTINGLAGDDRINGCAGGDRIDGSADDDGIAGGPQNDIINGNEGDDVMQGDSGDDRLDGGPGINFLTGGPGRDVFVCNSSSTVTDFVPGTDRMIGPCMFPENISSISEETGGSASTLDTSTSNTENTFNAQEQNESDDPLTDVKNDRKYKVLDKHAERGGLHGDAANEIKYRISNGDGDSGSGSPDLSRGEPPLQSSIGGE
jgi:RTX calcium-binding nonapeptide repeat (4 copies)